MEIKERNSSTVTESTTKIEYIEVTEKLVVYKTTINETMTFGRAKPKYFNNVTQGFAKKSSFKSWVIGDRSTHRSGKDADELYLFKDGFCDMVRKYGPPGRFREWSYEEYAKYNITDPFDAIVAGANTKNILRPTFSDDGMLWDIDGNPLPVAIHSDYMNGIRISNSQYNLEKALKILKKNKNVWFPNNAEIKKIPYYNATHYNNHMIEFVWSPTQKEYTKLWEKQKSYKTMYTSCEQGKAIFDLDMLGLRKGHTALFNDFWGGVKE